MKPQPAHRVQGDPVERPYPCFHLKPCWQRFEYVRHQASRQTAVPVAGVYQNGDVGSFLMAIDSHIPHDGALCRLGDPRGDHVPPEQLR